MRRILGVWRKKKVAISLRFTPLSGEVIKYQNWQECNEILIRRRHIRHNSQAVVAFYDEAHERGSQYGDVKFALMSIFGVRRFVIFACIEIFRYCPIINNGKFPVNFSNFSLFLRSHGTLFFWVNYNRGSLAQFAKKFQTLQEWILRLESRLVRERR